MAKENANACFRTSIGGQALIEGIMMRGPKKQAVVVRQSDGGLVTKVEELKVLKDKYPIVGWPLIRGVVNFGGSMSNGVRALMFSAEQMPEEEQEEPSRFERWVNARLGSERAEKLLIAFAVVVGIAVSIGLFMLLPTLLAGFLDGVVKSRVLRNIAEGALRIALFLVYLWFASKMKEMRRVWQYHGAEHKTIFAYEAGLPLTVENTRVQPRCHPRCGTSFMFIVMIVSILVFSVVRWSNAWVRMGLRLVLLPVVVGISYELIKWAGRHDNIVTRIISAPGKALQRLTTAEPDDSMLEVAIEALRLVMPESADEGKW